MHHIREGKHGARSTKQAIAIGLSKARRAGVNLRAPKKGKTSAETRESAQSALRAGRSKKEPSPSRSRATRQALRREGRAAASPASLSRHARSAARRRGHRDLSAAARKAARTRARQSWFPMGSQPRRYSGAHCTVTGQDAASPWGNDNVTSRRIQEALDTNWQFCGRTPTATGSSHGMQTLWCLRQNPSDGRLQTIQSFQQTTTRCSRVQEPTVAGSLRGSPRQ